MRTQIAKSLALTLLFVLLRSGLAKPMFEGPGPAPTPGWRITSTSFEGPGPMPPPMREQ